MRYDLVVLTRTDCSGKMRPVSLPCRAVEGRLLWKDGTCATCVKLTTSSKMWTVTLLYQTCLAKRTAGDIWAGLRPAHVYRLQHLISLTQPHTEMRQHDSMVHDAMQDCGMHLCSTHACDVAGAPNSTSKGLVKPPLSTCMHTNSPTIFGHDHC